MIHNRPRALEEIPYYNHLPRATFELDASSLPEILKFDIFVYLCGLLPVTRDISNLCPNGISAQPSQRIIDYYSERSIKFQMILVVANVYNLKNVNGVITGRPYNISLVPAEKRGKVDERDVVAVSHFQMETLTEGGLIDSHFDPFEGSYGLFGPAGALLGEDGLKTYTDSIGFVIGGYFLATEYKSEEVLLPNIASADRYIQEKYHKYRVKRYFRPFAKLKPRKLWGADSPIELFLIQGLGREGLFPDIQTLIFQDGSIFPNFYEMVSTLNLKKDNRLLTEVDLYFKQERVAIFCDSTRYHRSKKAESKDANIVNKLNALGIRSLRIRGSDIVGDLPDCVARVREFLTFT